MLMLYTEQLIRYAADTVEASVELDDWPEQAELDYQRRKSWSKILEISVTNIAAKHPNFIWWMTITSGVVPIAVFFAIDGPFLYYYGLPQLPLIILALFVWACSLFLYTSFMDPGVIKSHTPETLLAFEKDLKADQPAEYAKTAFAVQSGSAKPQFVMKRQYTWDVSGQEILTDWCYHCKIFKAPRVHHCKLCGRCIERFDHHCPWLHNCVGIRNYPWFLLMLISYGFLWTLVAASSVVHIILRGLVSPYRELGYLVTTVFEVAAAGANLHFLSVLLVCQHDLLKLGITVHEFKTDKYFNRTLHRFQSPFDRGSFWLNVREACISPWRPKEVIPKSSFHILPKPPLVTSITSKNGKMMTDNITPVDTATVSLKRPTDNTKLGPPLYTITEEEGGELYMTSRKPSNHLTINVVPVEPVTV